MSRATAAFADAMEICAGYVPLLHPVAPRHPSAWIYSRIRHPRLQDEGTLIRTGDTSAGRGGAAPSDGQSLARPGKEKTIPYMT